MPTTRVPRSNAAKTRNPLKFAGVPQTRQQISAVSRPRFTILREHVEEESVFNSFFWLSIHALAAKMQPKKVVRWFQNGDFLHPVFSASHLQHISDLHSKFALRPHHVWKYGRHPVSDRWDCARKNNKTRMWANAQRDGRPAEYRWRPLFNAAKFGWHPLLECRAVTLPKRETCWNLQGCPKLANRSQPLVGRSSLYY